MMVAHHEKLHGELDMSALSAPSDEGMDEATEKMMIRGMDILAGTLNNAFSFTKKQH
jgi:hypothetical protein